MKLTKLHPNYAGNQPSVFMHQQNERNKNERNKNEKKNDKVFASRD